MLILVLVVASLVLVFVLVLVGLVLVLVLVLAGPVLDNLNYLNLACNTHFIVLMVIYLFSVMVLQSYVGEFSLCVH